MVWQRSMPAATQTHSVRHAALPAMRRCLFGAALPRTATPGQTSTGTWPQQTRARAAAPRACNRSAHLQRPIRCHMSARRQASSNATHPSLQQTQYQTNKHHVSPHQVWPRDGALKPVRRDVAVRHARREAAVWRKHLAGCQRRDGGRVGRAQAVLLGKRRRVGEVGAAECVAVIKDDVDLRARTLRCGAMRVERWGLNGAAHESAHICATSSQQPAACAACEAGQRPQHQDPRTCCSSFASAAAPAGVDTLNVKPGDGPAALAPPAASTSARASMTPPASCAHAIGARADVLRGAAAE